MRVKMYSAWKHIDNVVAAQTKASRVEGCRSLSPSLHVADLRFDTLLPFWSYLHTPTPHA
jgi:hypothetical protein